MNTNKHLILDNRGNLSTTLLNFLKENGYRLEEIFLIESPYFRRIGEWRQSGFSLGVLVIKKNELGNFPINDNLKIGEILW